MATMNTATVKTWRMAESYIRDIADGETLRFGTGNRYDERYTAIKELMCYELWENSGNGRLGKRVAVIFVDPAHGQAY